MLEGVLRRYLERQAVLGHGLLAMCRSMDEFLEAVDAYAAVLAQEDSSPSREALLEGLRKQKEFFQGVREHLWEIGKTMSREQTEGVPTAPGDEFHALLHDFEPDEKEIN